MIGFFAIVANVDQLDTSVSDEVLIEDAHHQISWLLYKCQGIMGFEDEHHGGSETGELRKQ